VNLEAQVIIGDNRETLKTLPEQSVQTVITSPPYFGLRDYGEDDQIGLEATPQEFIEQLCLVFDEVWRVLKDDGTLWVNLGDSYAGSGKGPAGNIGKDSEAGEARHLEKKHGAIVPEGLKPKDLIGIPWRFAFAMQERGWYLRQDIIWAKPNPMPESVTDRCTKSHEYIFLLAKKPKYYYNNEAIKEEASPESIARTKRGVSDTHKNVNGAPGQTKHSMNQPRAYDPERETADKRNKRSVWTVNTKPYKEAHFAVYPPELIEPCILAASKEGDIVLDPFSGSGTTGEVALKHNRNYIGLELNPDYAALSERRLTAAIGMFGQITIKGSKC
jgi:DNA modification methylase